MRISFLLISYQLFTLNLTNSNTDACEEADATYLWIFPGNTRPKLRTHFKFSLSIKAPGKYPPDIAAARAQEAG